MSRQERLAQMLLQVDLRVPPPALPKLILFLDEMLRWNRRINLTAITREDEALEKHLVDSLTALPFLRGDERLLDLGSGAGFPGIPLKLARPDLKVVSVDSVGKKIAFQRHVGRLLEMRGFAAMQSRAEELPEDPEFRSSFEVIVSRAFAALADFARLASPCLASGGFLLAMKGPEGEGELVRDGSALAGLDLRVTGIERLTLPFSKSERILIVLRRNK